MFHKISPLVSVLVGWYLLQTASALPRPRDGSLLESDESILRESKLVVRVPTKTDLSLTATDMGVSNDNETALSISQPDTEVNTENVHSHSTEVDTHTSTHGGVEIATPTVVQGRQLCSYEETTEDPVCQQHCIPRGYSYGVCTRYVCSCI